MRYLLLLLALAGCGTPGDVAEESCAGLSGGAYERCYAKEYDNIRWQHELIGGAMLAPRPRANCVAIGGVVSCR